MRGSHINVEESILRKLCKRASATFDQKYFAVPKPHNFQAYQVASFVFVVKMFLKQKFYLKFCSKGIVSFFRAQTNHGMLVPAWQDQHSVQRN